MSLGMEFKFRKYKPEDKKEIIDLLGNNFWSKSPKERCDYFKWKFEDNPFLDSPCAFVATYNDSIVAFRGYFVIPIRNNDNMYFTAQLCDTFTHPDFRNKGLYSSLTAFSLNQLEKDGRFLVTQNTSSGGKTMKSCLKLGWKPISEREHLFKFTAKGIICKLIGKSHDFIKADIFRQDKHIIIADESRLDDMLTFSFKYDRMSHIRDKVFYSWRLSNPLATYRYAYIYDLRNHILAYIIFLDMGGGRYDIIDFNYSDEKALKQLLNKFCHIQKPLFILHWTVGKKSVFYSKHNRFGFLSLSFLLRRSKKFFKPPFMVRKLTDEEGEYVYNPEFWNLNKIIADEV